MTSRGRTDAAPPGGEKRYRFFQHRACEFFPCHSGVREEDFNCLFCYCPLYALGRRCGGSFVYTPQGITGIVVAPGMHEIHGVNEYTSAQELTAMAQVVAALITDFDHQEDGL